MDGIECGARELLGDSPLPPPHAVIIVAVNRKIMANIISFII
tara:strand:+ start:594 stop:719 length:126 start_codon:yes stop_codon:yes gene_type:complete